MSYFHHVIWNHFVFYAQNKIIRIAGIKKTVSYRELCLKSNILLLTSELLLLLLLFIVDNVDIFKIQIYTIKAQDRDITSMYQPLT
jgi:hypothetical protein